MKLLLLGATGRLGSRVLPALLAHKHEVVVFARNPSKLSSNITPHLSGIFTGDAKSSSDITRALLEHDCDALINTAGLANMAPWGRSSLRDIFPAVLEGAVRAGQEKSRPLRAWFLAGMSVMEAPVNERYLLGD